MTVKNMCGFIILLSLSLASAHIADYSQAKYIPIIDGEVLVWEEFAYVTHTSNLSEYMRILDETASMSDMFPQSHMKKLLEVDTAHIRDLLESLGVHHRIARSLDFLGSILKVVAGTPDAGDLEKTRFIEMQLTNANNRQVAINTKVQDKINELTTTVNQILKTSKDSQVDTGHLYETLLARNRMLMMELQNLMLAITLAKANIVSPNILDHTDLKSVWLEEPTNTPIGDLMSVASVKILQSTNALHFIIKFPKIKNVCKKVTIFPVTHRNVMLRIMDNVVAMCGGEVHTIRNCAVSPGATFCQTSSDSSCARELHAGVLAHCATQPSDLHPVTRVDEGILIINDQTAKVRVDNGTEVWVHGTHLVTFESHVFINETLYVNHDKAHTRTPGVARSSLLNITFNQDVLSLPYLQRLNERNVELIKEFDKNIDTNQTYRISLIVGVFCCAMICVGMVYLHFFKARRSAAQLKEVIAEIAPAEGGLNPEGGVVNKLT